MDARCRIQLMGELRITQGERVISRFQTQKTGALLAYLAYHLQQSHPREVLMELLWPESEPDAGRNGLRVALSSLRRQLEPPGVPAGALLQTDYLSVRLNPAAISTDVNEFEVALQSAKKAHNSAEVRRYLEQAVDLYAGRLLPGYYQDWIAQEQDHLTNRYFAAVRQLIELLEQAGERHAALELAQRAVATDAYREEAHRDLIRLLAATGQVEAALRQFRQWEQTLQREFDESPTPATLTLVRQIESQQQQEHANSSAAFPAPKEIASTSPPNTGLLETAAPPIGTLTFLLIDIGEKTAPGQTNAETDLRAQSIWQSALLKTLRRHGGHKIRVTDAVITLAFGRASDALACAVSIQRMLAQQTWSEAGKGVPVRMALDTREVRSKDGIDQEAVFRLADRLLTAAHDGQILCSASTATLLRRELDLDPQLVDLGPYRFLDLSAPEQVFQVDSPGMPSQRFPALNAAKGFATELPLQFTRFFGREKETVRLQEMLLAEPTRLVTLTGPGGTGKTRLALEVAARLMHAMRGAVWFVPLADLRDAQRIAGTIAEAMRLPHIAHREPIDQVAESLSRQSSLLVLDNFEQLVEGGASVVHRLLERIPSLTCLVTSRQILNLEGETQFKVAPLPTPQGTHSPEQLTLFESVQLFVDRAQAVRSDFQVTRGNAEAIAELCDRLEGIPLALELAASRASVLTPAQMLKELTRRFDFLVSRKREVADRHRTLRAAIDWSYQGLAPELQRLFARLSVFRGGWTVEAAEQVTGYRERGIGTGQEGVARESGAKPAEESLFPITSNLSPATSREVLEYLQQLQENSLVLTEESGAGMRFRMLETLGEYAGEQLDERARADLQQRHGEYFLSLAEEAEGKLKGKQQVDWLERLESEHGNLLAALTWCGMQAEGAELSLRLAGALSNFWMIRGHVSEGRLHLGWALERTGGQTTVARAKALLGAGKLAWSQADYTAARALLEESLRLHKELGDRQGTADVLHNLGRVAENQGDYQEARTLYEESLRLHRELGNKLGIADVLHNLGNVAECQGDYAAARVLLEESLTVVRELGNKQGIATALVDLGLVAYDLGDYAGARALFEEGLSALRELGNKWAVATTLNNMGNVAKASGDYTAAWKLYEEAQVINREVGNRGWEANTLSNLGVIAYDRGDHGTARALFEQSLAIQRELGSKQGVAIALVNLGPLACETGDYAASRIYLTECLTILKEIRYKYVTVYALGGCALLSRHLNQAGRAARLWAAAEALRATIGLPLPPDEREVYDRNLTAVREALGDEVFATAWAEGLAMTFEQAVDYALEVSDR